ncbi:AMP-binding enzyme [Micromonospora chersina]
MLTLALMLEGTAERLPGRDAVALAEDELVNWCRERMAGYKYPRLVEFRDELPMTSTGKTLKRRLRDQA